MASDTWYRVDNVAKVFLASCGQRDSRTFRVCCTLKEDIDDKLLNEAVAAALSERPSLQVIIQRGIFWHYMESTDTGLKVTMENDRPCPLLYDEDNYNQLHLKVSYFNNRINLEMFHAIADGNGAIDFLNLIVNHYLRLKYPDKLSDLSMSKGASDNDLSEDSFKQFYSKSKKKNKVKEKKAYQISGIKHPYKQLQFFEVHMPVNDVIKKSKETGVTLTSYMAARFLMAVYKDMPALKRNRPVTISMPVNLRKYYPSSTARNFFNSVNVSHVFKKDDDLQSVATEFNTNLKAMLTPEAIAERMDGYEQMEREFAVKLVPLFIKNPVVNAVTRHKARKVTAVISNLGIMEVPKEAEEYIDSYVAYCSTNSMFITLSTYGDELVIGISSAYRNTSVLKNFIGDFAKEDIPVTVYATEVV